MICPGDKDDHRNAREDRHSRSCAEIPARIVSDKFEMFGHGENVSDATLASPTQTERKR